MRPLHGSHWLLRRIPWWLLLLVGLLSWIGYWLWNHLQTDSYDIALGENCLAFIGLGLANSRFRSDDWVTGWIVHVGALILATIVGLELGSEWLLGYAIEGVPGIFYVAYISLVLYALISVVPVMLSRGVPAVYKAIFMGCLFAFLLDIAGSWFTSLF